MISIIDNTSRSRCSLYGSCLDQDAGKNGVGRPSTYAPTLDTIQRRYYVRLVSRHFEPAELGEIVNPDHRQAVPRNRQVKFTAEEVEDDLDRIEEGKENWVKVVDKFWPHF